MSQIDRSRHSTVVEYAVQEMFKKKSYKTAAKNTAAKLSGHANLFLGVHPPNVVHIDVATLEDALLDRMAISAKESSSRMKPGMEDIAVLGTLDHFRQPEKLRPELERRMKRLDR